MKNWTVIFSSNPANTLVIFRDTTLGHVKHVAIKAEVQPDNSVENVLELKIRLTDNFEVKMRNAEEPVVTLEKTEDSVQPMEQLLLDFNQSQKT
jgi:hypothetical protein